MVHNREAAPLFELGIGASEQLRILAEDDMAAPLEEL